MALQPSNVSAQTNICFSTYPQNVGHGNGGARALAYEDFNNDGKKDLMVEGSRLSLLLGNSTGNFSNEAWFDPAIEITLSVYPTTMAAGDLNLDGNMDLVLADYSKGKIYTSLGDGNGHFATPLSYNTTYVNRIIIADVNNDTFPDAVIASGGGLFVMQGDGTGALSAGVRYSSNDTMAAVIVDLNNDGNPDIAATTSSNKIVVLMNDGAGGFLASVALTAGTYTIAITAADFNGDGNMDLATANHLSNNISVLSGDGNGNFSDAVNYSTGPYATLPFVIMAADFNNDGKPDIATGDHGGSRISILIANATGTFNATQTYSCGGTPYQILPLDYNHDGRTDIVTANNDDSNISLLAGNGAGYFSQTMVAITASPIAVTTADFNNDGKTDVAAANDVNADVAIFLSTGNQNGYLQGPARVAAGNRPYDICAADFNGDGKKDLATANYGGNDVSILMGDGAGGFAAAVKYTVGTTPKALVSADFNHDGKADLAVSNYYNITLMTGDGAGSFTNSTLTGFPGPINSLGVIDLNLDGNIDLITANNSSTQGLSVLLGNGAGGFSMPMHLNVSGSVNAIATGDFNHDNFPDVAITKFGSISLCVLLGDGTGALGAQKNYGLQATPNAVAVGDFNADNHLDIITAVSYLTSVNKVSVWIGDGTGNFTLSPAEFTGVHSDPRDITTGDFNNDGLMDFITADYAVGTISPYVNTTAIIKSVGNVTTICQPGSATLMPVSAVITSYTWMPGNTTQNSLVCKTAGDYILKTSAGGCISQSNPFTLNMAGLTSTLTPPLICYASTFNYTPTSANPSATFTWSRAAVTGISQPASSGTGSVSEKLTNTTTSPINVTYIFNTLPSTCGPQNVVVKVMPSFKLTSDKGPIDKCSLTEFTYYPTCATAGVTFTAGRPRVSGIQEDPNSYPFNGYIKETLTNTTPYPVDVPYYVSMSLSGCSTTEIVTIRINRVPGNLTTYETTRCSGTAYVNSGVTGTWTRSTVAGITPAGTSGTGPINETFYNSTTASKNVAYYYTQQHPGCASTQDVIVLPINPIPTMNSTLSPPAICSGTTFSYTPTSVMAGQTFSWSRAAISGISESAKTGTGNVSEVLTNTTTSAIAVNYLYTPKYSSCSGTAQTVTVIVNPLPNIVVSPAAPSICTGTSTSLSASGASTYTWSPSTTLSTTAGPVVTAFPTSTTTYTVTGQSSASCINLKNVTVTLTPLTTITTQPSTTAQTVCPYGSFPPLSVAASGTGTLQYQWYRNSSPNNSGGASLAGATSSSYLPSSANVGMTYYYYAKVTGACGIATSNVSGAFRTAPLPTIVSQPSSSYSVCQNSPYVLLTINATAGLGTLRYQWYKIQSGLTSAISGATSASYYAPTTATGSISYKAVISDDCTSITSNIYAVQINPTVIISSFVGPYNVCPYGTYSYTANISGGDKPSYTYTWTKPANWTIVSQNRNNVSYSLPGTPNYGAVSVSITVGSCTARDGVTAYPQSCGTFREANGDALTGEDGIADIEVYPNPANTEVVVTVPSTFDADRKVSLYSMVSQVGETFIRAGYRSVSINTSDLSPGLYIFQIETGAGLATKKVMIVH
jgi:hypothetical protein